VLGLPFRPELWVLRQELLGSFVELGSQGFKLFDDLLHVVPRDEMSAGRCEWPGALFEGVPGLLLDLLEHLAGLVRIEQILGAEAGDGLGGDPVAGQLKFIGIVGGPAAPVGALDDEEHAKAVDVDGFG